VEGEGLALCYCHQVGIAIITSMRAMTPTTSKRGISGYMQVRILDGVIHRIGILKAVIHSNRLFRQGFRWGFRRRCPAVLSSRTGHGSDATLGPVPWWEWGHRVDKSFQWEVSGEGHVVGEPVSHCSHTTPGHLNIPSSPQRLVSLARRIQYPSACSATVHNTMQDGGSNIIPTFDALSIEQVVARRLIELLKPIADGIVHKRRFSHILQR
jgi:hypothetical protein